LKNDHNAVLFLVLLCKKKPILYVNYSTVN